MHFTHTYVNVHACNYRVHVAMYKYGSGYIELSFNQRNYQGDKLCSYQLVNGLDINNYYRHQFCTIVVCLCTYTWNLQAVYLVIIVTVAFKYNVVTSSQKKFPYL